MKAILISIQPKWVAKILNGEKTIEIRKTMPKCDLPIDVYIYCCKDKLSLTQYLYKDGWGYDAVPNYNYAKSIGCAKEKLNGKVVAKFTLNKVEEIRYLHCGNFYHFEYGMITSKINEYLEPKGYAYAWHIDSLEIFDKPKELSEFEKVGSYNNPTIKCKKKERGWCNYGISPYRGKWVGCEKARLTKAPQSWCYVEVE